MVEMASPESTAALEQALERDGDSSEDVQPSVAEPAPQPVGYQRADRHTGPYGSARYDDDDYSFDDEERLPSGKAKWVILLFVLIVGGGGYGIYYYKTSPYFGDPPAHLKITKKSNKAKVSDASSPSAVDAAPKAVKADAAVADVGVDSATNAQYAALVEQAKQAFAKRKVGKAYRLLKQALKHDAAGWEALQHLAWSDCKAGPYGGGAVKRAKKALGRSGRCALCAPRHRGGYARASKEGLGPGWLPQVSQALPSVSRGQGDPPGPQVTVVALTR